jgi:hypothetical protein
MNGFGFLISSMAPVACTVVPLAVTVAVMGFVSVDGPKPNIESSANSARIGKVNRCGRFGSVGSSGTTGPLNSNDSPPTGFGIEGLCGGFARLPALMPSSAGVNPSTTTYTAGSMTAGAPALRISAWISPWP